MLLERLESTARELLGSRCAKAGLSEEALAAGTPGRACRRENSCKA